MRNVQRWAVLLILALLGALCLGAPAADAADSKGQGAWIRAAHLIPGLGTMTIGLTPFQGGSTAAPAAGVTPAPEKGGMREIAPAADYGQVTDYQQIPAGIYTMSVWPAGTSTAAAPLISGTLKADAGQAFTVAGLGTRTAPRLEALTDDLTPPEAGKTRVRLLPAASSAKTVTVTAAGGPAVAQDAAFGRPTGYAAVPAGAWTLKATADGSTSTAATSKVDLAGGSVYTLLVVDKGSKLKVTPVLDASGVDAMPKGGAQTGGGWLATHAAASSSPERGLLLGGGGLVLAGLLTLGGLLMRANRVTAPVTARAGRS